MINRHQQFKVVRAYYRLPPEPGGMEYHIARLSEEQRALGIDVVNLFNTGGAEGPSVRVLSGLQLRNIRPSAIRNALFYCGALVHRRDLKGSLPIVLHVHGDWSDFLYSKVLAMAIGAKVTVASIHGVFSTQKASFYKSSLSHCQLVFATGKRDQVWLQELLKREVHHLPSAPQNVFFKAEPADEAPVVDVISIANLFPNKRLDLIVECARIRPLLRFAVYGDGPERERILAKVREEKVTNIQFPGRLSSIEIANALRTARLFLLTSDTEGTPTAALEAMAVGLPVVLTPSNDYDWLVKNGENGFVVSSWSVDELVARIDDVLSDESKRVEMGRGSKAMVKTKHSWRVNGERVSTLMSEALKASLG